MTVAAIDLQLLANAGFPLVRFASGDVIFKEGTQGDNMYVIRSGEIEIARDGKVIEMLGPGGVFGEMALIDSSPRSATAAAKTACVVVPISEKTFLFLVHETPLFALAVMRTSSSGSGARTRRCEGDVPSGPLGRHFCLALRLAAAMIGANRKPEISAKRPCRHSPIRR